MTERTHTETEVKALVAAALQDVAKRIRAEGPRSPYHSGMTVVYQCGLNDGFEAAAQIVDECARADHAAAQIEVQP